MSLRFLPLLPATPADFGRGIVVSPLCFACAADEKTSPAVAGLALSLATLSLSGAAATLSAMLGARVVLALSTRCVRANVCAANEGATGVNCCEDGADSAATIAQAEGAGLSCGGRKTASMSERATVGSASVLGREGDVGSEKLVPGCVAVQAELSVSASSEPSECLLLWILGGFASPATCTPARVETSTGSSTSAALDAAHCCSMP